MLGEDVISYCPGQSMLTSIDLPVISHVMRASVQEPLLGLMLNAACDQSGRREEAVSDSLFSFVLRRVNVEQQE